LKRILQHQIDSEFERSSKELAQNLSQYVKVLMDVDKLGRYAVTITVEGEDVSVPMLRYFELLEKSGMLKGELKFTHRSMERIYTITRTGKDLLDKLITESMHARA
jgi:hypothetical protein